jgi:hypothetical protein
MNEASPTFRARQRGASSKAMALHADRLRKAIEAMRADLEIVAADAESFDGIERDLYSGCIARMNGCVTIFRHVAAGLIQEART